MSPLIQDGEPPTRGEIAGKWCIRLSSGALAPDKQIAFDAWLADDPANGEAFDKALTVWGGLHAMSDTPEIITRRVDALEALRRSNHRRWSRRLGGRWQFSLGLAASVILIVVASLSLFANRPTEYATGIGERRAFLLVDGSRLSLDAETKVAVDYESDHRELRLLSGRAKFDVARDPARPFTVTAADRTVIATGTAFSVELLGSQVHIIVYEGSVAVVEGESPPAKQLLAIKLHPGPAAMGLAPGRELIADVSGLQLPQVVSADVARSLAWEAGQLDFVDESLTSAAERINRNSANKIVVGDSRIGAIQVNGVFNAGDTPAFVEAISEAYPVRSQRQGDNIVLISTAP